MDDVPSDVVEAILAKWRLFKLSSPCPRTASPNWDLPVFVCSYQSFINLKKEIPDGVFARISAKKSELPDTATCDIYIAFQVLKSDGLSARFRLLKGY